MKGKIHIHPKIKKQDAYGHLVTCLGEYNLVEEYIPKKSFMTTYFSLGNENRIIKWKYSELGILIFSRHGKQAEVKSGRVRIGLIGLRVKNEFKSIGSGWIYPYFHIFFLIKKTSICHLENDARNYLM